MAKDTRLFARLDLDYADHPKIVALSDSAFRAHIEMILYARKYMTDGYIPNRVANRVGFESVSELLTNDEANPSLVKTEDGDYYLHGYADMNETKEEIESRTRRNAENGKRGGRPRKRKETQSVTESAPQSQTHSGTQKKAETETESETYISTSNDALFEDFWNAYPRKIAKKEAGKKFAKAVKDGTDPNTIIAGAKTYAASVAGKERKYIAHPTTWLNQGRWEDEAEEPAPKPFDLWNSGGPI